jgi:hypothetical protein
MNDTLKNCSECNCWFDYKGTKCYKCISRIRRASDRVKAVYYVIKTSAKRRGLEFTLTLEYLRKFCKDHGYIESKGRLRDQMTIDRIDNSKGYTDDNIQVLQKGINSSKYHHFDKHDNEKEPLPF